MRQPNLLFLAGLLGSAATAIAQSPPAFPGAEGFGAIASGGRGGSVLYVTTLDPDPSGVISGSLNWALRQSGPRTVLFKVSGVIHGIANVVHGDLTIAGQTSPGGITVRGLICDGHYEQNQCDNLIVRHLRSRPGWNLPLPPGGERLDDALRLDGINRAIFDHVSLAHATDEALQISWTSDLTVQYSTLGETVGEHADRGGALLNYSHPDHPQDRIALIKNLWYRVGGRTPEITCESSNYDGQPGLIASCQNTALHLELSDNIYADPGFLVWYNRDVDQNAAAGPYRVMLNAIDNRFLTRPSYPYGMFLIDLIDVAANELYVNGNRLSIYPDFADYQLFYCCNDFAGNAPNTASGNASLRMSRHPYPAIAYLTESELLTNVATRAGALPADPLNRRWRDSTLSRSFPTIDYGTPLADDSFDLDFDPNNPPAPPIDTDQDGMPDAFEIANVAFGLNPGSNDANGSALSVAFTGVTGYTNLECYLNALADGLIGAGTLFASGFE
jgi:pectate lyase